MRIAPILVAAACSCGGAGPASVAPGPQPPVANAEASGASADPQAAQPASGAPRPGSASSSARPPEPVSATASPVPGTTPLDDDEQAFVAGRCVAFQKALGAEVRRAAGGDVGRERAADLAIGLLAGRAPGPEPRCAELVARDLRAFAARAHEAEAIMALKTIALGVFQAATGAPPVLCPSAPPTPPRAALAGGPVPVVQAEWQAEGWRCVRYVPASQTVRYQLELRSDPKTRTYEVVARGRALPEGPLYELALGGAADSEDALGAEVMRR